MTTYCAHGVAMSGYCTNCDMRDRRLFSPEELLLDAAQKVADARVAEATAFLRFKTLKGKHEVTDRHAQAQAVVETGSALDIALAKLELARRALSQG